jgi:hypothetical protein
MLALTLSAELNDVTDLYFVDELTNAYPFSFKIQYVGEEVERSWGENPPNPL